MSHPLALPTLLQVRDKLFALKLALEESEETLAAERAEKEESKAEAKAAAAKAEEEMAELHVQLEETLKTSEEYAIARTP